MVWARKFRLWSFISKLKRTLSLSICHHWSFIIFVQSWLRFVQLYKVKKLIILAFGTTSRIRARAYEQKIDFRWKWGILLVFKEIEENFRASKKRRRNWKEEPATLLIRKIKLLDFRWPFYSSHKKFGNSMIKKYFCKVFNSPIKSKNTGPKLW